MSLPATRITDMHVCPAVSPGPVPHVGGPFTMGSPNVLIGKLPAVRLGDQCTCVGPPDMAAAGSTSVLINNKPAVRISDTCSHGGTVVGGLPTVLVGTAGGGGGGGGAGAPGTDAVAPSSTILPSGKSEAELDQQIQDATGGLTTELVQDAYEAQTGEEISTETLDMLFNGNAAQAGAMVTADDNLHVTLRDILNSNRPSTVAEARAQGWQELPQSKNAFHDPSRNIKFVGPNGHRELVINPANDMPELRDRYRESFNFRPPSDAVGHTALDVVPYGLNDPGGFAEGAGQSAAMAGKKATKWAGDKVDEAGKWVSDAWSSLWD